MLIGTKESIVTLSQSSTAFSKSSCANNAALKAPIEVPEKTSIYLSMDNSFKAFQTPSSYAPFPPPPAKTKPIFI